jgi:hypothetical protein
MSKILYTTIKYSPCFKAREKAIFRSPVSLVMPFHWLVTLSNVLIYAFFMPRIKFL